MTIYRNKEYEYIDTSWFGYELNVKDNAMNNILFAMQEEKISHVNTIFWFIGYTIVRATLFLQEEAKLIESLVMYNHGANVWDNVIVIYKGLKITLNKDYIIDAIRWSNLDNIKIMPVYLFEKLPYDSYYRISDEVRLCNVNQYSD